MASTSIIAGSFLLLLAFYASFGHEGELHDYVGGSSTAGPLIQKLLDGQSRIPKAYTLSNSQGGIGAFREYSLLISVTSVPWTSSQEATFSKLTVPQSVLPLSLFTKARSGLKLSPDQLKDILLGKKTTWQKIPGSKLSGNIRFVTRRDSAGSTKLFTTYLRLALGSSWPSQYLGEGPFTFPNKNVVYKTGEKGVVDTLASLGNSIGWVQTGTGLAKKLKEVAVKNRAGAYVTVTGASKGTYYNAFPANPPEASGSWAAFSLVYRDGPKTYPVLSLVYFQYTTSYPRSYGGLVKLFGIYCLSPNAQNLGVSLHFYKLPSSFLSKARTAVARIVLTD